MNGCELLIDITTDEVSTELLKDVDDAKLLMLEIVRKLNLNVVKFVYHQFKNDNGENYGATGLLLLSESHLTIHTYIDSRMASINIYTCNPQTPLYDAIDVIQNFYGKETKINFKEISR